MQAKKQEKMASRNDRKMTGKQNLNKLYLLEFLVSLTRLQGRNNSKSKSRLETSNLESKI